MDVVRNFSNELSSVCEVRPPISRAKMAAITKSAIKGIKFYKHIVQSVEKFIHKGRPEFKVPGLYVMDSIVRQSRHQFSSEKDVFGPRFSKNIVRTFQFLFQCKGDDRSKVIRVLNLWQKNCVFSPAVIQPLLDLATDPTSAEVFDKVQKAVQAATGLAPSVPVPQQKSAEPAPPDTNNSATSKASAKPAAPPSAAVPAVITAGPTVQNEVLDAVAQLLQQSQKPQQSLSLSAQQQQLQQLQLLQQQLMQQTQVHEPKPVAQPPPILDTALLGQIQTLTNQLMQTSKEDTKPDKAAFKKELLDFDYGESEDEDDKKQHPSPKTNNSGIPGNVQSLLNDPSIMKHLHQMSETIQKTEQLKNELSMQEVRQKMLEQQQPQDDEYSQDAEMEEGEVEPDYHEHRREERRRRRRSKDRSRSRSRDRRKRRKTRSRSRDRKRSRSREWRSKSGDEGSENRSEKRRREKERKALGFPTHLKDKHMTVCSTTIWIGHLSKNTTQDNIMDEMVNYGEVLSVNLVPPRGCAYVCLNSRKDASRALNKLKGVKLLGNTLKMAWATNKGILESKWKHLWDVDQGSTFIPWNDLPDHISLDELTEGGVIDPETIPKRLRNKEESNQDVIPAMSNAHPLAPVPPNVMPVMPPPIPAGMPPMMMPMNPMMMPGMPPMMPPMSMPPPLPPNLMGPTLPPPVSLPMQVEKAPEPPLPPEANDKPSHLMQTLKNLMNQYGSSSKPPPSFSVPPPGFDPSQPPPPIMASNKPPLPMVAASPNDSLPMRKEVLQSPEQAAPVKSKNSINIVLGSLKTSSIQQLIQEAEQKHDGIEASSPPPSGSDIEMSMSDQEGDGQIIEYQAPPPQNMVMPDMSMPPPNMMNMSSPLKECPPFPPPPINQTKFTRFSDANSSTNGASIEEFSREAGTRAFNQTRSAFPRQKEEAFAGFERGSNSESTFGARERNNSEGESGFGRGGSIRPLMSVQNPHYNQAPPPATSEFRKKPDSSSFGNDYDRDRQKDAASFGRQRDEFSPRGSRSRERGRQEEPSRGDWNRDNRDSRHQDGYRGNERHSRFGSRWNDDERSRGGRRSEYDRNRDMPFSTDKHERMLSPRYDRTQEPPASSSHQEEEATRSEQPSLQHSQEQEIAQETLDPTPPYDMHEHEQSEQRQTESAADETDLAQAESYPVEPAESEPAPELEMAEPQEQYEPETEAPEPAFEPSEPVSEALVEDPEPVKEAPEPDEVAYEPAEAAYEPAEAAYEPAEEAPEPLSSTTEEAPQSEEIAAETTDTEAS